MKINTAMRWRWSANSALPAAAQEEVQDGLGFSTLEELEAWLENMES